MRKTPKGASHNNNNERHVTQALRSLGVEILEPQSDTELEFADALHAFSRFVLIEKKTKARCRSIIESYLESGDGQCGGVGVLQGGDEYAIYRLQIRDDEEDDEEEENSGGYDHNPGTAAATEMLQAFHASPRGSRYRKKLTIGKLKTYLLRMCERWEQNRPPGSSESHRRYIRLGNLMWILSFGPVPGQYRHIDNIDPNTQICCYMSDHCPSTVVYDDNDDGDGDDKESNQIGSANNSGDGEVQYCPALLHLDLCAILFATMKNEYSFRDDIEHQDSKTFLIRILVDFIAENPKETYSQNLADGKRKALREWIEKLCDRIQLDSGYDVLIEEAVSCDGIICGEIQEDSGGAKKKQTRKRSGRSGRRRK